MFRNKVLVSDRGLLSTQEYSASTAATYHAVLRQYSCIISAVPDDTDNDKVLLFSQISLLWRTCESRMTPDTDRMWQQVDSARGRVLQYLCDNILCCIFYTPDVGSLTDASPDNPGCREYSILHSSIFKGRYFLIRTTQ